MEKNQATAFLGRSIVQPVDMREPLERKRWQRFDDVAELLAGSSDDEWEVPGRPADDVADPWELWPSG
jgi:hypothetical protein